MSRTVFAGAQVFDRGAVENKVGTYAPNPFGLHDMHGNVAEWCRDAFADHAHQKVARGGSYDSLPAYAKCSWRDYSRREWKGSDVGVRPARPVRE